MQDEKQMRVIGMPRRRVDARAKVTGQTRFADEGYPPLLEFNRKRLAAHRLQEPASQLTMNCHRRADDGVGLWIVEP